MKELVVKYSKTFVAGALGFAIMFSAWHLYIDHQNLHILVNMVQSQQARPTVPTAK